MHLHCRKKPGMGGMPSRRKHSIQRVKALVWCNSDIKCQKIFLIVMPYSLFLEYCIALKLAKVTRALLTSLQNLSRPALQTVTLMKLPAWTFLDPRFKATVHQGSGQQMMRLKNLATSKLKADNMSPSEVTAMSAPTLSPMVASSVWNVFIF